MNKINQKTNYTRKRNKRINYKRSWEHIKLSYISIPKLSQFAKSYSNYSNERYIYIYAYPIDNNGKISSSDLSYHVYNTRCDMNNKNIKDFTQYINKNFYVGEIVNAYVVSWKRNNNIYRMITRINHTHRDSPDTIIINTINTNLEQREI